MLSKISLFHVKKFGQIDMIVINVDSLIFMNKAPDSIFKYEKCKVYKTCRFFQFIKFNIR